MSGFSFSGKVAKKRVKDLNGKKFYNLILNNENSCTYENIGIKADTYEKVKIGDLVQLSVNVLVKNLKDGKSIKVVYEI
jgi:hypothetical protein